MFSVVVVGCPNCSQIICTPAFSGSFGASSPPNWVPSSIWVLAMFFPLSGWPSFSDSCVICCSNPSLALIACSLTNLSKLVGLSSSASCWTAWAKRPPITRTPLLVLGFLCVFLAAVAPAFQGSSLPAATKAAIASSLLPYFLSAGCTADGAATGWGWTSGITDPTPGGAGVDLVAEVGSVGKFGLPLAMPGFYRPLVSSHHAGKNNLSHGYTSPRHNPYIPLWLRCGRSGSGLHCSFLVRS